MFETVDIFIFRVNRSDQGIEGILTIPALKFSSYSLELPWRDNRPNVSCIPPGTYPLAWRISRRFKAYHIKNVPSRSAILIHSGNFAGDIEKGFKTHVQGCVLLGRKFGKLQGQRAVLSSRNTVKEFNALLEGRTARITIIEVLDG